MGRGKLDRNDIRQGLLVFPTRRTPTQKTRRVNLEERIANLPVSNNYPFYGLDEDNLKVLRSSEPRHRAQHHHRSSEFLKRAYAGIRQMTSHDGNYSVPHAMLTVLHPMEILVLNYAAFGLKAYDHPHLALIRPAEVQFKNLGEATLAQVADYVQKIINDALGERNGFLGFRFPYYRRHPAIHLIPLKERLSSLPEKVKSEFMQALRKPYRSIEMPNADEKNDLQAIDIYRAQIAYIMSDIYNKNISKPAPIVVKF